LNDLIETQVVPETPDDTSDAWVKVSLVNIRQVSAPDADYFNAYFLQLDCYPSGDGVEYQEEAFDLCNEVRALLTLMPAAEHDEAVVTAVRFGNSRRLPDQEFKPPRHRYFLEAYVYGHAA